MSFSDREKRTKKKVAKKVSVIVPNYNYARYLKWRIMSIAQQSYPIYELIILADVETSDPEIKALISQLPRFNKYE